VAALLKSVQNTPLLTPEQIKKRDDEEKRRQQEVGEREKIAKAKRFSEIAEKNKARAEEQKKIMLIEQAEDSEEQNRAERQRKKEERGRLDAKESAWQAIQRGEKPPVRHSLWERRIAVLLGKPKKEQMGLINRWYSSPNLPDYQTLIKLEGLMTALGLERYGPDYNGI
jgi:hypothetical protein